MAKLKSISKIAKIFISVAAVTVAVCVAGVCYLTAGDHLNIPELYIHTEDGGSAQAIRGGFEWSARGKHTLSDSMSPLDFNYSAENSLTVKKGVQLTISNQNCDGDKKYPFTIYSLSNYKTDGNSAVPGSSNYVIKDSILTINAPEVNGEYIYDLTLTYNQGTVNYGLKVFVTDDGLPVKTPTESTTINPLDAEFWFPMTNHLHTFSFDGKEFTSEDDFMAEHAIISDLDASVYFDVNALCKYARELSGLSESQIDAIAAYQDTKTIGEHRYINLIDLRGLGVYTVVGWIYSSHTPVDFYTSEPESINGDVTV